jgi:DNA polymerase-3 subunit delta'
MMLCGPDGCGKMALAIGLATYILNKGTYQVKGISHPDLHFTFPTIKLAKWNSEYKPISDDFIEQWNELLSDGPYFSLAQWMEAMRAERQQAVITVGEANELIKRLMMKSNQGGWKISIIWLPERMNIECANKILKLLEEPPSQTVFIMVCQEPDKLLETIRSRVQRIDIKRIADEDNEKALHDKRGLAEDVAYRTARMANGSWLKALEMLSADSENELFLDMFQTLMRLAYQRKVKDLKTWSERMAGMGREKQKRFLTYFLRLIRENFMYNFHQEELCYMNQREEDFAKNFARFVNEANILPISELANRAIRDIGQNANAKIVFFDMALQMIVLLIQK